MIEKITNVLPNYELFLDSFPEDDNLQRHVVSVYVDILDFWRQATEVFLKRGKSTAPCLKQVNGADWFQEYGLQLRSCGKSLGNRLILD
jgi:hypothetical protein